MKKIAVLMILLAAVLAVLPGNADAASLKMKKLKAGKTYRIDLNGGKKEKVKYTVKDVNESTQRFRLYVNGKVVFKKDIDDWSLISSVKTVDFIQKDKYTEIFVDVAGSYSNLWFFVLRYVSPKKVIACTKFMNTEKELCPLNTGRMDSGTYKNTGKNKLYVQSETPFYNSNFGCYYILAPVKLKKGKIMALTESKYKLTGVKNYTPAYFGGKYYRLKADMTLYKKASFKNKLKTLTAGDTFVPTYIRPMKPETRTIYDYETSRYPLFVKVKTSDGTVGWLYFPAWSEDGSGSDYLTAQPSWG